MGYLGFAIAAPIAAGAWLGSLVDEKLGTRAVFAALGILTGVGAGALSAYRIIRTAIQQETQDTLRREVDDSRERDNGDADRR